MSPKHGPWRAKIVLDPVADAQIARMTDEELARLDPVLVHISEHPHAIEPYKGNLERKYNEGGVRVVYLATALGTVVLVVYVEA